MPHQVQKCRCSRKIHFPKNAPDGYEWQCHKCEQIHVLADNGKSTYTSRPTYTAPSKPGDDDGGCSMILYLLCLIGFAIESPVMAIWISLFFTVLIVMIDDETLSDLGAGIVVLLVSMYLVSEMGWFVFLFFGILLVILFLIGRYLSSHIKSLPRISFFKSLSLRECLQVIAVSSLFMIYVCSPIMLFTGSGSIVLCYILFVAAFAIGYLFGQQHPPE